MRYPTVTLNCLKVLENGYALGSTPFLAHCFSLARVLAADIALCPSAYLSSPHVWRLPASTVKCRTADEHRLLDRNTLIVRELRDINNDGIAVTSRCIR